MTRSVCATKIYVYDIRGIEVWYWQIVLLKKAKTALMECLEALCDIVSSQVSSSSEALESIEKINIREGVGAIIAGVWSPK